MIVAISTCGIEDDIAVMSPCNMTAAIRFVSLVVAYVGLVLYLLLLNTLVLSVLETPMLSIRPAHGMF
jgi:hypothetical protein